MELSAIPTAEADSMVLDQSAGSTAPLSSETTAHSATSQIHTEEVLDTQSGTKMIANATTQLLVARSGEPSGTPSAVLISTMLHAASVHLTAQQARLILVSHAPRIPTAEVLESP